MTKPKASGDQGTRPLRAAVILALAFLHPLAASAARAKARSTGVTAIAVAPQYSTSHVYVAPADLDALVKSLIATFGGTASQRTNTTVTPVASSTETQLVRTPVGALSLFAYRTPVPFPFGEERTGNLVTDIDRAVKAARAAGAEVIVAPFTDPIGKDAVIQWPGGVKMQLYWHFQSSTSAPLATIPESRVYVSQDRADSFVRSFTRFLSARVAQDDRRADAGEIGRVGATYRRIRISSQFGNMLVLVTDGHLPYPFGRESTGYQVADLPETLDKAKAAGAKILTEPHAANNRSSAIVEFPGGYIAEIHSLTGP